MAELRLSIEKYTVLAFLACTFIFSYKASAYRAVDELQLLDAALKNSYTSDLTDTYTDDNDDDLPTDKRYARLSYNYANRYRNSGRRHFSSRYYRSRYYANYYKPWLNLPEKDCFRQKCQRDSECCRRYSKCDRSAHVCYNCWYGHPCRTSRDCCQNFPVCNRQLSMCVD